MSIRTLLMLTVALVMVAGVAAAGPISPEQKQNKPPQQSDRELGLGITVIRLKWADAQALGATLAPMLPEGVKVVAYPRLNALVISWDSPGSPSPSR